jgi:hypothetical protein
VAIPYDVMDVLAGWKKSSANLSVTDEPSRETYVSSPQFRIPNRPTVSNRKWAVLFHRGGRKAGSGRVDEESKRTLYSSNAEELIL